MPAIGWAIGLERLIELYKVCGGDHVSDAPDVYVVAVGDAVVEPAFKVIEQLRAATNGLRIEMNCGGGSFRSQLKRADRSGAQVAVILGEAEVADETVGIKPLRDADGEQVSVGWGELGPALAKFFD